MCRYELLRGHTLVDGEGFEDDEDARRAMWFEHRDELLAYWIQDPARWKRPSGMSAIDHPEPGGPGTRPWAWWRYEAPEMRRPIKGTLPDRLMIAGSGKPGLVWAARPKGCDDKDWREATYYGGPHYLGGDVPWVYEAESDYLARLGLLTDAERRWLRGRKPSPDENFPDENFSEEWC